MMPFGGSTPIMGRARSKKEIETRQRRCQLEYLRLKYIIEEKCRVTPKSGDTSLPIQYDTRLFKSNAGDISTDALRLINEADVLVAMILDTNVNVIYELAIRNALRDIAIMIVEGPAEAVLPIYVRTLSHIAYSRGQDDSVRSRIDAIAKVRTPPTITTLPEELRRVIDSHDTDFCEQLQKALQEKEDGDDPPRRPAPIEKLFPEHYVQWSFLGHAWEKNYFPYSIVKIPFKGKDDPGRPYIIDDIDGGPSAVVVCEWNEAFLDMYGITSQDASIRPLNDSYLMDRLQRLGFVSESDCKDFRQDQVTVFDRLVLKGQKSNAMSQIPLRLSAAHSDANYRNREMLPCIIGRWVTPDRSQDHVMYLAVIYVDITSAIHG